MKKFIIKLFLCEFILKYIFLTASPPIFLYYLCIFIYCEKKSQPTFFLFVIYIYIYCSYNIVFNSFHYFFPFYTHEKSQYIAFFSDNKKNNNSHEVIIKHTFIQDPVTIKKKLNFLPHNNIENYQYNLSFNIIWFDFDFKKQLAFLRCLCKGTFLKQ